MLFVSWGLWVFTFVLQVAGCAFALSQLRSPLRFPRWQRSWAWGSAMMIGMLIRRVFWLEEWQVYVSHDFRELLFSCIVSLCAYRFAWTQARLYVKHREVLQLPMRPPASITIDSHSTVLAWDNEATQLFGYTATEAIGQNLTHLIMEDEYATQHREGMARWLANPTPNIPRDPYSPWAIDRYGNRIRVSVVIMPVQRPDGTYEFHGQVRKLIEV